MKRNLIFLLTLLILLSVIIVSSSNNINTKTSENEEISLKTNEYTLKLENEKVVLFEGDKIIKQYDIILSVLPGEDIEMLLNGIKVNSIAEADHLAEDYDG